MELIIGGRAQGKLDYALKTTGYPPEEAARGVLDGRPILDHLEELVRRGLEAGEALPLERLLEKEVILCDEIGCGVVPMDPMERRWREETGRLCCTLAQKATRVTRIFCGIPTILREGREE